MSTRIDVVVATKDGDSPVSIVVEGESPTVGDLAVALGAPDPDSLWVGALQLAAETPIVSAGIRRGERVSFEPTQESNGVLVGPTIDLRVITGPVAGQCIAVPEGGTDVLVGRDPSCQLAIADPTVSRRHARMAIGANGVQI